MNTLVRQVSFLGRKLQRRGSGVDRQLDHQARRAVFVSTDGFAGCVALGGISQCRCWGLDDDDVASLSLAQSRFCISGMLRCSSCTTSQALSSSLGSSSSSCSVRKRLCLPGATKPACFTGCLLPCMSTIFFEILRVAVPGRTCRPAASILKCLSSALQFSCLSFGSE